MGERKGRSTVYNMGLTSDYDKVVSKENRDLIKEFLDYLKAADKSPQTITQYEAQLKLWACWNAKENNNTFFVNVKKRQFIKFFSYLQNDLEASSNRVCSLRSVLSSLSNFIERILDEDYPSFRNIVKVLEPVNKVTVREKTILEMDEIEECLQKLINDKKYQIAACLAVLASSGMRKSEIIQTKMSDVTESHLIFSGIAYKTDTMRTKGRGAAGKRVPRIIFRQLIDVDKYIELWRAERERLGIENEYMFLTDIDGKYQQALTSTIDSYMRTIERYLQRPLYAHALRHAQTRALILKGVPVQVVQACQSWSSADLVNLYSDLTETDKLEGFFNADNAENPFKIEKAEQAEN